MSILVGQIQRGGAIASCTVAAIVLCVACGGQATHFLIKGNQLLAQGKVEEAALNYRKAIQKDPLEGEAFHGLGLAEFQLEHRPEALAALKRAAELLPASNDVNVALANVSLTLYLEDSSHPATLYQSISTISEQLLAKDARSYDGLRLKGHLATIDRAFGDAERYFRLANEVRPMQSDVVTGWMNALFQLDRFAEAEKLGFELIHANPHYGPVYDQLQGHYLAANRVADAEKIVKTKVDNNPTTPEFILQLASFYEDHSNPAGMQATLDRILASPRTFPGRFLMVGDFWSDRQRWDAAVRQYQEGAQAYPADKVTYLKKIVDVRIAQGKLEDAAAVVAEIRKQQPRDDSALAVNASLLLARGKPEDVAVAASQYKALVDRNPHDAVWRYAYGRALATQEDVEGARSQELAAIVRRPNYLQPRLLLAELSQRQGDSATALRYADESLAIDPENALARLQRATALLHSSRPEEARQELRSLEKTHPDEPKVQVQLGWVDLQEKKYESATRRFSKLVREHAGNADALSGLVETLGAEGASDKIVPLLEEELARSPRSNDVRALLAATALRLGQADVALDQYQKLAAAQPNAEWVYLGLGQVYSLKQDVQNARLSLEKAGNLAPKDPAPPVLLGQLLVNMGRGQEAIQSYRRALALQPANAGVMNDLAYELAESGGNLEEARSLAEQAVRLRPKQPNLVDTLGWVYFKQNRVDSAIQVFRNLTVSYPENAAIRYHLGIALFAKGDKAAARAEWKTALSREVSPEMRRNLEGALAKSDR